LKTENNNQQLLKKDTANQEKNDSTNLEKRMFQLTIKRMVQLTNMQPISGC